MDCRQSAVYGGWIAVRNLTRFDSLFRLVRSIRRAELEKFSENRPVEAKGDVWFFPLLPKNTELGELSLLKWMRVIHFMSVVYVSSVRL